MRLTLTTLFCLGNLFSFAQSNADSQLKECRFREVLAKYNAILPLEKVYVQTDQSYYEPGETVWFKAYLVDEQLKAQAISSQLTAVLLDPKGNTYQEIRLPVTEGSSKGDFTLDYDAPGGIYTLRIYSKWQKNFGEELVFEKKLTVQKFMVPNLLMTLDFLRESYGPGSEVVAKLNVRSKDDVPLANKTCNYTVELAGKKEMNGSVSTNEEGECLLIFKLPEDLKTADGLLNIIIEHDGTSESISRSIPIITRNITMQLLPEGGDMIADIDNRIAFKALDEFGNPVDFNGRLVDGKGQEVLCFQSYHQGMGAFQFTPKTGESYKVQVYEPIGIEQRFELPKALNNGIALQLNSQDKNKMQFKLHSPQNQPLCLVAQLHGAIVFEMGIDAKKGNNDIEIPTKSFPIGIAQITVFDAYQVPHAERLVFVNKHRQLKVDIRTHRPFYQFRDSVELDIRVTDETGRGVAGDFAMAVVDDKLWTFADDKQDNILSYLLMSSDLRGKVYEPDFYFNPKEPKADTALDYVLLTHGWRRYQWRELMAKEAEKNWKKQRQYEPEPLMALAGILTLNDEPLPNTSLQINPAIDSCFKGARNIKTDDKGAFLVPNLLPECPFTLIASHRGFKETYSTPTYFIYAPEPGKQNSVMFRKEQNFSLEPIKKTNGSKYSSSASTITYIDKPANGMGILRGIIQDTESGESIPFATVKLSLNDELKYGAHSDIDGLFQIVNIQPGAYTLRVNSVGYEEYSVPITILADKVHTQNISLSDATLRLDAVEIRAIPTTTMNLESSIQFLAVSPGVDIARIPAVSGNSTAAIERTEKVKAPKADADKTVTDRTELLIPRIDGQIGGERDLTTFSAKRKMRPNVATINALKVVGVTPSTIPENSVKYEMSVSKGESITLRGQDKSQNGYTYAWTKSSPLQFQISQAGPPNYYTGKVFYAPDHTDYLNARNSGQAIKVMRSDFRNTVFWQPYLKTDTTGYAKVLFYNSDAISTFRIVMEGLDMQGNIGRGEQTYSVQMPFELDVKIPRILTFGDTVLLSFLLKNNTDNVLESEVQISAQSSLLPLASIDSIYHLAPKSVKVVQIPYLVNASVQKQQQLLLTVNAANNSDRRILKYEVHSKGFPISVTLAGNQKQRIGSFEINDLVNGSLSARLDVFSNVLEDISSSLIGMLRAPSGCFEQVSSSTYPNIMALQLLKEKNDADPRAYSKAYDYIQDGYKRLAAYESAGGGFDWWGKSPAHECLTAYGLMEFHDMKKVFSGVDDAMVARAYKWLLSRRDGNGGFMANEGYTHGWGNTSAVRNAYIVYALSYIGEKDISRELAMATTEAESNKDLYRLGLVTLANYQAGNSAKAEKLLDLLNKTIETQGLNALRAEQSVTYAYGMGLQVEILALAALSNIQHDKMAPAKNYVDKIMSLRSNGYFGGTQSTVLALKALTEYVKHIQQQKAEEGTLYVYVNKKEVLAEKVSTRQLVGLKFHGLGKYFKEGKNELEIRFEGLSEGLPYDMEIGWNTLTPPSSFECPLAIKTSLTRSSGKQGETIRLQSKVTNKSAKDAPSAMAMIGIPAGLSLQPWQLKEILDKEKVAFYEIFDNYLVLYYRNIPSGETRELNLDLKAEVPGTYLAPASCTYLYYTPEYKQWVAGEQVNILN